MTLEDMGWTGSLRMEFITGRKYFRDRADWGCTINPRATHFSFMTIKNPIAADSYATLVKHCLESPYFVKLNVRNPDNNGRWEHFRPNELLDEEVVAVIDGFARRDLRELNHFEAAFRYDDLVPREDLPVLEFARHPNGLVVGYKVQFLASDAPLFDCEVGVRQKGLAVADPHAPNAYQIVGR